MAKRPWRVNNLTGRKFGKLTVIEQAPQRKLGEIRWRCQCDCGKSAVVVSGNLTGGGTKSCGCMQGLGHPPTHGYASLRRAGDPKGRIYRVWHSAKQRCENPNDSTYKYYGARGIQMCAAWREDFAQFIKDMGPRPEGGTLERRDNDGPYAPENCYWATRRQQAQNRRTSRQITWRGETHVLSEWARITGFSTATLWMRLNLGWTVDQAFTTPLMPPRFRRRHAVPDES